MVHQLTAVPVDLILDRLEGQPHTKLGPDGTQTAHSLRLPRQTHQLDHLVVETVIAIKGVTLLRKDLFQTFTPPVRTFILFRFPQRKFRHCKASVLVNRWHPVTDSQFLEDDTSFVTWGEAFH